MREILLMGQADWDEIALLTGISDAQLEAQELREEIEERGFNPDNPKHVRKFHELKSLKPTELDVKIKKMQRQLGLR